MSDSRQSYDEQLPWLQAVDDEDEPRGLSARKMLAALTVVLLAGLILAGTFFWLGRAHSDNGGAPELIQADPRPYKVKPADPGGLDVAGESETAFETSAGEDKDAQLDLNKLPETGIARPPAAPPATVTTPKTVPTNETKVAVPAAKPAAPSGAAGSVVQLGAFANQAQAERAWTALSARFPKVAAMSKMIVPFPGGIRLRASAASPADAKTVCQTLISAGENCFVAH